MKYRDWEKTVPEEITGDSLWKIEAYRLALLLNDIGWYDVTKVDKRSTNNRIIRSVVSGIGVYKC